MRNAWREIAVNGAIARLEHDSLTRQVLAMLLAECEGLEGKVKERDSIIDGLGNMPVSRENQPVEFAFGNTGTCAVVPIEAPI